MIGRYLGRATRTLILLALAFGLLPPTAPSQAQPPTPEGWTTRAGGVARTGSVPDELPLDNGRLHLRWKRFLGERIEVEMEPVVVGDLLYIGLMNGKLYALDRDTSATVWVYAAGMGLAAAPSVDEVAGRRMIFFGATDGVVYGLDALTGEPVWTYTTGGPVLSTPSAYRGAVYVGSLDGKFYALDAATGAVRWAYDTGAPIANTSAVGGEVRPGQAGIFVASGDNVAYAFSEAGELVWRQQMDGVFTKRTYAVYANGVVMFVTRKAGREYSEPAENLPDTLQVTTCLEYDYQGAGPRCLRQSATPVYCNDWTLVAEGDSAGRPLRCHSFQETPRTGPEILDAWADYYLQYPRRRTLYFFDARTGADLWQPDADKTRFMPLYIPYWGSYMPVVDDQGFAWLPASGSGGDHALDHDIRLWRLDLRTGEYVQAATQDAFLLRFDEVGRPTLVGRRYYQTISEDIGYYDIATGEANADVFGNGMGSHRMALELEEMLQTGQTVFGGMHKFFTRFACSSPGCFGGGNDAPSPLVVVGDSAYFTTWGHIYALSAEQTTPRVDYGALDLTGPPATALSREEARAMLNAQVQAIVDDGAHIGPVSRMWTWTPAGSLGTFWHHGEVVRTLAETLPYLDSPLQVQLAAYLKREVETYLLDPAYYEPRSACLDFDTDTLQDPCARDGAPQAIWMWNDPSLVNERLYALHQYASLTGDWETIQAHWGFIRARYEDLLDYWDAEAGFFLFPEWLAGEFNPNLQVAGMLSVREMAAQVGDSATRAAADGYLSRMYDAWAYWGGYVRRLYDTGALQPAPLDTPETWGYTQLVSPMPAEGYVNRDNDYRQVYALRRDGGALRADFERFWGTIPVYYLIGFHPVYPPLSAFIRANLSDQLADLLDAIDAIWPWWYMGDYGHGTLTRHHEEDSLSPLATADIFQARAYVFNEPFETLAPYLPWPFEAYGYRDIFRLQNLVALLHAP